MECSCNLNNNTKSDAESAYGGDLLRGYFESIGNIELLSEENERKIAQETQAAKDLFYECLQHNDYYLKFAVDCYESISPNKLDSIFEFPRSRGMRLPLDGFKEAIRDNIRIVKQVLLENSFDYSLLRECCDESTCFSLSQEIFNRTEKGVEALKRINFRKSVFFEMNHRFLDDLVFQASMLNDPTCHNKHGILLLLEKESADFHMSVDNFRNYLDRIDLLLANYTGIRNKFIIANLRLVVDIAKKLRRKREPLIDVIQDGNVGLIKAIDRYDCFLDEKFSTYATYWIKYNITNSRREFAGHSTRFSNLTKILSKTKELTDERGRRPDYKTVAEETGVKEKIVRQILSCYYRRNFSIYDMERKSEQSEDFEYIDSIIRADSELPEQTEKRIKELRMNLNHAFRILDNKLKSTTLPSDVPISEVIKMYYGLSPYAAEHTLEEISNKFPITREGVRQMIARYKKALVKYIADHKPEIDDLLLDEQPLIHKI